VKLATKRILTVFLLLILLFSLGGCHSASKVQLELVTRKGTEYTILRNDTATEPVVDSVLRLKHAFQKATGTELKIESEYIKTEKDLPKSGKKIFIGTNNRTFVHSANLKENDFIIDIQGNCVDIIGGSDDATVRAVDYFIKNIIGKQSKNIKMKLDNTYVSRYAYPIKSLTIGENNIGDYRIVVPTTASVYELYTAEFLRDHLYKQTGCALEIVKDNKAETAKEILIGTTNREVSKQANAVSLGENEYILCQRDQKLVIVGKNEMVSGGVGALISKYLVSEKPGKTVKLNVPSEFTPNVPEYTQSKNVILMIGDGMGYEQIKLAEHADMGQFCASFLPNKGSVLTQSLSGITDSAAAATALSTGYKTQNGRVGLDQTGTKRENMCELAKKNGCLTGIITTDDITGATPAAFYAHVLSRDDTKQIQSQLTKNKPDFIAGTVGGDLLHQLQTCIGKFTTANQHFFLLVEEEGIDSGGHTNDAKTIINGVKRFNDSVAYAMVYAVCHPDTILLVSADHETGGLCVAQDGSYSFTTTGHTSATVPIFAIGKGTELFLDKTVDNTEISKFITRVFCKK